MLRGGGYPRWATNPPPPPPHRPPTTLEAVIAETFSARSSEREGRLIDSDQPGSMEKKKQEGYF
jgi:hypothetical protein